MHTFVRGTDFLKDRYDYELKRKDQITVALTLPVGILIALGAAMAAMARSFSYTDGYLTWCFLLSLGSAAVAFFSVWSTSAVLTIGKRTGIYRC